MKNYQKPCKDIWHGRTDSKNVLRIHQKIKCFDLKKHINRPTKKTFCFLGFASDAGVKRNKGREGAKMGPKALRQALANLPTDGNYELFDFGDIICENDELENAQYDLGKAVAKLLNANIHPIVLGGGHEVAFGHYLGIEEHLEGKNCSILNFDAHYDLRPLIDKKIGSSGTSFTQIANRCKNKNISFNYTCLGIQKSGNTRDLFDKASELGVHTVFADDFFTNDSKKATKAIDNIVSSSESIYLTICLDVFSSSFAQGVSAPQPLGLLPWHVIPLIEKCARSGKVISLDIAELSPPNDKGSQTAKLAAELIYRYINAYDKRT